MFEAREKLVALNHANLDAAALFAGIALAGAERMFEVQLKTTKSAIADGVQQIKALTEIRDVRELDQWKNASAQPAMDMAASYVKSVYEVAAATHSEINRLVEKQLAEFNKQVVTSLDRAVKSAPPGSEVAVAAIKSAITAVNAAYDNLSKSAKQFADIAKANVEAATTQAGHAARKKTA